MIQARANGLRVATSSNVRTELGGGIVSKSRPGKEGSSQEGKYQQGVSVTSGHPDPKIGPQVYLGPIKNILVVSTPVMI